MKFSLLFNLQTCYTIDLMTERKIGFIIPGWGGDSEGALEKYGHFYESAGIEPVGVDIDWSRKTTLTQNVNDFLDTYSQAPEGKKYGIGFSLGATILFAASAQVEFDGVLLCSLSPYFREEDAFGLPSKLILGKNKMKDMQNFSYTDLAPDITSPTTLLAGTKEKPCLDVSQRVHELLVSPKKLIVADGARHMQVTNSEYKNGIEATIFEQGRR